MASFKKYCVTGKFKLTSIDPAEAPFLTGTEEAQRQELEQLAVRLDDLQNNLHAEGRRKLLLVLQGLDTSGKDGTIRWVFSRTSPLGVRVKAFKVPSEDERAHDFLWRCHAAVPPTGDIAIWNRSHYEDVLVPVVEGLIDKAETQRRYAQINDFERLLTETGTVVIKCMLHISREEQRKRLQARIDQPDKHWKFHMDDLSVRKKWADYELAYEKALAATSTAYAPWHVVPADSKIHRNLMVAHLIVKTLEDMKLTLPPASPALEHLIVQ
ncbi:PPK2 family polyphosphate kinase [Variovorax ureilyticus]|uniref:PPK2 family polyphosphate kinase n=1 Tax=Variovorax ureilyticus TaxID=1836198 RepID=UPI003D6658E7